MGNEKILVLNRIMKRNSAVLRLWEKESGQKKKKLIHELRAYRGRAPGS